MSPATEPFPRSATRAEELRLLRAAHARHARLEVEDLATQELVRALTWQVDRAKRRLAATAVVPAERRAHAGAALRLGAAQRRALELAAERRAAHEEILTRAGRLSRKRKRTP